MEYRKFPQGYVMRLDPGEEIVEQLTALVNRENVRLGSVSALGAAGDVTIGIFNTREKPAGTRGTMRSPPWWGMCPGRRGNPTSICTSPSATRSPARSTPGT